MFGNGKAGADALLLRENPIPNREEENDGDDDDDDDDEDDDEDDEDDGGGGASPNNAERIAGLKYESLSRDRSKNTPDDEDEGTVKEDDVFGDLGVAAVVRKLDAIGIERLLR